MIGIEGDRNPVEFPIIFNLSENIRVEGVRNQSQGMQWEVDPLETVSDESRFQSFLGRMSLCVVDRDDLRSTKDSHSDDVLHESSGFVRPIDISYKLQAIVRHIGREAFAGHYVCGAY